MSHKAQAVALTCIDFRFRKALHDFFEKELGIHMVDHKADGGGVKKIVEEGPVREWIFDNFNIAFNLHGVDKIVLINHQDCGAYGGSKAFKDITEELAHHEEQLKKAEDIVRTKYPDKEVDGYIALLDDTGKVSFKKVV
jgi:carbonic anhydrase